MAAEAHPLGGETPGVGHFGTHPYAPRPYVVRQNIQETPDTFTLRLEPRVPGDRLHFQGGQFNMVYVFGVGESAISISGDPTHPEQLVHTVRAVGKITNALAAMKPGATVGIRGPYGHGWPLDWNISTHAPELSERVTALVPDQLVRNRIVPTFWEGAARATGTRTGTCFVEISYR